MKKLIYIFLFINVSAICQNTNAKLDSLFYLLAENNKGMGSIMMFKNNKVMYQKTFGYACLSDSMKSNSDTKYRIGSVTKMFTAVLIMQLIEQKKIKLSTPLSEFYPLIPNANQITIEHLLYHRSGIFDYVEDSTYLEARKKPISKSSYLSILEKSKSLFSPNSKFTYSNSNYILLGYIIEKIYSTPFNEVVQTKICQKLKLKNTFVGDRVNCSNNEAKSYEYINGGWIEQIETDMSFPGGAGSIISTPEDLIIFITNLYQNKLLKVESLSQMLALKDEVGMAMFPFPFYDKIAYGHTGGIDSFHSMVAYFIKDSLAIAYCTNGEEYPMNDIMLAALSSAYKKPFDLPKFAKQADLNLNLQNYTGTYGNSNLKLSLKITVSNNQLNAQIIGQPSFPLEAFEKDKFKFEKAGVIIEFSPSQNQLTLKQGGGNYIFKKF